MAFLAAHPDGRATKDKLVAAVWPEVGEASGANRMHVAMNSLRELQGRQVPGIGPDVVRCERNGICRFDPSLVWSDAQEFTRLAEEGLALAPTEAIPLLEQASGLYRGDLFAGKGALGYAWIDECGDDGVSLRDRYCDL